MSHPAIETFRATRRATLELVASLSQRQIDYRPEPNRWSLGEILDHLARADRIFRRESEELIVRRWSGRPAFLLRTLADYDLSLPFVPRPLQTFFDLPVAVLGMTFPRPLRQAVVRQRALSLRSPRILRPDDGPDNEGSVAALLAELEAMIGYVDDLFARHPDVRPDQLCYYSPVTGLTSIAGAISFTTGHEARHQEQMQDVLASPGFPRRTIPIVPAPAAERVRERTREGVAAEPEEAVTEPEDAVTAEPEDVAAEPESTPEAESAAAPEIEKPEAATAAVPDVHAEAHPFQQIRYLLDRSAFLNVYSIPDEGDAGVEIRDVGGVVGVNVREALHRFQVRLDPRGQGANLRAANDYGERIGAATHRWLVAPDDFAAEPDREPPPTVLDPSRSQRFVMLDGVVVFEKEDGEEEEEARFRGSGTGRTFPVNLDGQPRLLVAAVGTILDGSGKLGGGHHEGTYTYCGTLDPARGFEGNLLIRLTDPEEDLSTPGGDLLSMRALGHPSPGLTYLQMRARKEDREPRTELLLEPDGAVKGWQVELELRAYEVACTTRGYSSQFDEWGLLPRGGLRSITRTGQIIGVVKSRMLFDHRAAEASGAYSSRYEVTFRDPSGNVLGGFVAAGGEGRRFPLELGSAPGLRAWRLGGFQVLAEGSGCFEGVEGIMTDNSVLSVAPHAPSHLLTLCINDSPGKFRS